LVKNRDVGEISVDLLNDPGQRSYELDGDYPGEFLDGSWAYEFDMTDFKLHILSL